MKDDEYQWPNCSSSAVQGTKIQLDSDQLIMMEDDGTKLCVYIVDSNSHQEEE